MYTHMNTHMCAYIYINTSTDFDIEKHLECPDLSLGRTIYYVPPGHSVLLILSLLTYKMGSMVLTSPGCVRIN